MGAEKVLLYGQAFSPSIFVSDSDFVAMTKNGALCNEHGHLGPVEFENVMREQVNVYQSALRLLDGITFRI